MFIFLVGQVSAIITITMGTGAKDDRDDSGFTIVEMIVTLVLASLFVIFLVQFFLAAGGQQISVERQAAANNLARTNLSKFPRASSLTGYTCDPNTTPAANTNNLTINPSANGTLILSNTVNNGSTTREAAPAILPNVTQEVRAYSPMGCMPSGSGIVKIVSRVTYGYIGQTGEVVYATYVQE